MTLVSISTVSLFGCSITTDQGEPSEYKEVQFACDRGVEVQVRFFSNQGLTTLLRNGQAFELKQQPGGTGFYYSNGPMSICGKADDLSVVIGKMAPLMCKAQ
ncbi:MAG: lysozyme inhibitor [Gammaproteobacteria bacterium]|nr:lysozyme inhibitor [Gammaproteobacteria bacterium]